jgi:hypothetical protein
MAFIVWTPVLRTLVEITQRGYKINSSNEQGKRSDHCLLHADFDPLLMYYT